METGYVVGQNVAIEFRWADGQYDRLPALAVDLVGRPVTVIAATGDAVSALAAQRATTAIPTVFVIGGDPTRFGLVNSFNRPSGNITGVSLVSSGLGAKRLGLLQRIGSQCGCDRIAREPRQIRMQNLSGKMSSRPVVLSVKRLLSSVPAAKANSKQHSQL